MNSELSKIPSFTIDHERLLRGIYVSRKDEVGGETVTTFDIRMKEPNREPVLHVGAIHYLLHDLPMAKWESRKFLSEVLNNITDANLVYPEK